jgi:mycothiol synthase
MTDGSLASVRPFRPGDEPAVMDVVDAALPVDRIPGIDRTGMMRAVDRMAGDPGGVIVALEGTRIVGYCAPRFDDITVHPEFRRRGHGTRLIEAALAIARSRGQDEITLYGSTNDPAGAGFIAALGATYHSSIWLCELGADAPAVRPAFPPDVVVRAYRDPADMAAYVALATASFADHPTSMEFTEVMINRSHSLPEFDPESILLVAPADDPDTLVAWTKVRRYEADDGAPRGSIDFIGVLPAWRRRGLGRELLRWGIDRLRATGAGTIELNVTASNERALELYRRSGFVPVVEWPHYALRARR